MQFGYITNFKIGSVDKITDTTSTTLSSVSEFFPKSVTASLYNRVIC